MPSKKRATIDDIASRARVSKSTVSRVLNDTTPVAPEKEQAVLAAISELEYQPNFFARGLASGQSMAVGVLTQNVGSPFYDTIMRGIILGLEGSHHSPIFADGRWHPDIEQQALQALLGRRVDGLIVVGGTLPVERLHQLEEQVPIIVVAREIPGLLERCVFVDNERAAYNATRYLIDAGHREIAHVTGLAGHQDTQRRRNGYARALTEAGLEVDERLIVEGNFRRQSGVLAVETLLIRGCAFSAVFCANDQMAFGVRLALFRRGIRVPEEVSLIGFDDQPDAAFMTPPLTTIRQPAEEMGQAAAQSLLARLREESYHPPELTATLIVRESVRRFP